MAGQRYSVLLLWGGAVISFQNLLLPCSLKQHKLHSCGGDRWHTSNVFWFCLLVFAGAKKKILSFIGCQGTAEPNKDLYVRSFITGNSRSATHNKQNATSSSVPHSCKLNLLTAGRGFNLQIFLFHIYAGIKSHRSIGTELCMKFKTTLKVLCINPHHCNHMKICPERVEIKPCIITD